MEKRYIHKTAELIGVSAKQVENVYRLHEEGATVPFMARVREVLQAYNASLPQPESLGLLVELESKLLASRYTRASEAGFHFIGYSPRGLPLFASWFEGATLLPPAPIRTRNAASAVELAANAETMAMLRRRAWCFMR